jgi:hypothetical protein
MRANFKNLKTSWRELIKSFFSHAKGDMNMKPKITWKESQFDILHGYVAELRLFSIVKDAIPLRLITRIGNEKFLEPKLKTIDEAKGYAAAYLKEFLEKIEYEK